MKLWTCKEASIEETFNNAIEMPCPVTVAVDDLIAISRLIHLARFAATVDDDLNPGDIACLHSTAKDILSDLRIEPQEEQEVNV